MKILHYVFYAFYNISMLVKRKERIDHHLVVELMTVVAFTNMLTIGIVTKTLNRTSFSSMALFSSAAIVYFLLRNYFLKNNRYRKIVRELDKNHSTKASIIIGIGIVMITFISFPVIAWKINKQIQQERQKTYERK
jgi:uncharacterized membrane protein